MTPNNAAKVFNTTICAVVSDGTGGTCLGDSGGNWDSFIDKDIINKIHF